MHEYEPAFREEFGEGDVKDAQDLAQLAKMVLGGQRKQRLGGEEEQGKH